MLSMIDLPQETLSILQNISPYDVVESAMEYAGARYSLWKMYQILTGKNEYIPILPSQPNRPMRHALMDY